MRNTVDLSGRVAVVTGGSRGIGLAISYGLLSAGASVGITARTADSLLSGRERLGSLAGEGGADRLETVQADVRRYAEVAQAIDTVADRFGGLDILVNNAGVGIFGEVATIGVEEWTDTISTNLVGVFHCCKAAVPHLRKRGGGWIINISSLAGKNPFAGATAYCASKAGLNAFSEALMQEVRFDDIRVSTVMPGSVRTEFGGTHDGAGTEWKLAPEDVAQVVLDLVGHDRRSLPSRVELRPSKPRRG